MIKYTPGVQTAGESVVSHAEAIRQVGEDMFRELRRLVDSEQLTGPGIQQELERAQTEWNNACDAFATEEQKFGNATQDAYVNTMAADAYGGNLIAGA